MNLNMGSQVFRNVAIPLLWGKRAVVQDQKGRLSIISLEGSEPQIEILGDKPAPGIKYELIKDGFKIYKDGVDLYAFYPDKKTISGLTIKLPECEIGINETRIGTTMFSGNVVVGAAVGIVVDERGVGMGASLPPGLAKLTV